MKPYLLLAGAFLLTAPMAVAQTKTTKAAKSTKAVTSKAAPAATVVAVTTAAPAIPAAQRQAVETLLTTMQVEATTNAALGQTLTMQLDSNPQLKAVEPEMREFFAKYMSWPAIKEDLVQLYAREFTTAELTDLNQFYQTPTGQKYISKQSTLMQEGILIAQRRVAAHVPELQQLIMQKLGDTPASE